MIIDGPIVECAYLDGSRHSEQIVRMLRQADADIAAGITIEQVCKKLQISDATYYNWRKRYSRRNIGYKSIVIQNANLRFIISVNKRR